VTTTSIAEQLKISTPVKLGLMTGIRERRVCDDGEDSFSLALEAGKDCLTRSGIAPEEVEMILVCSITRYVDGLKHYYEPSLSLLLKKQLGLQQAISFDLSNACAGMLTGIHVASDFIERGVVENCLVISGEYITSLSNNAIQHISSVLSPEMASLTLGDAGAAIILCKSDSPSDRLLVSKLATLEEYSDLCIAYQSLREEGGVMTTQMKEIHEASIFHGPPIMEEALSEAGLTLDQIDYLIPHQTSRQAIQAGNEHFRDYFGTMAKHVVNNLERVGNTASTSHMVALKQLLDDRLLCGGEHVMLLSFASGLVIGVTIFTITELVKQHGSHS
jgi:3-oxoacyl-[acyl-carrier-protein] synthase-3